MPIELYKTFIQLISDEAEDLAKTLITKLISVAKPRTSKRRAA